MNDLIAQSIIIKSLSPPRNREKQIIYLTAACVRCARSGSSCGVERPHEYKQISSAICLNNAMKTMKYHNNHDDFRGRLKELPPPDDRFRQKLSKVAEALKSGGSSKKWRKLDQVGERKSFSQCFFFKKKEHDTNSKYPQMSTCKLTVVPRYST